MKIIKNCPVCEKSDFTAFLDVTDYMITKEQFKIVECTNCGFHFTNPRPDKDALGKYYESENYISHSSNNKGIINKLYLIVRKKMLKNKVKWVKNEIKGGRLLDIGSGTGHFLKVVNDNGLNGIGVEPNAEARTFAHKNNCVRSLPQEELFTIESNSYDAITMWHVLEHIDELDKNLSKIRDILTTNGTLFIAVPNMNSFDARYYRNYWAGYDVPRHLYHFTKNDISRLLLNYNFDLKKIVPLKYDSYYVSMLSEKYRKRFSFIGAIIGFISNSMSKKYGFSSQLYVFEKST